MKKSNAVTFQKRFLLPRVLSKFVIRARRILILGFSLFLVFGLGMGGQGTDPTDDLSFSIGSPSASKFHLISEEKVTEILLTHMVEFPRKRITELSQHLMALCREYRFDPAFVLSLIEVESGFKSRVVSPAGAVGLMQVMPATARLWLPRMKKIQSSSFAHFKFDDEQGILAGLKDPFLNLEIGLSYLAWLRDRYQERSPYYLVAAYNVGPYRLDELLLRKNVQAKETKRYYQAIRELVPTMRSHGRPPRILSRTGI